MVALGLESHPALLGEHLRGRHASSRLQTALTKVLYNASIDSMYRSLAQQSKLNKSVKEKQARRDIDLCTSMKRGRASYEHVRETAMRNHLVCILNKRTVYSCRGDLLQLESLVSALDMPATKKRRAVAVDCQDMQVANGSDLADCDDDNDGWADDVEQIFFKLAHPTLGKKKTVHSAPGAGGRVGADAVLVTVHKADMSGGDPLVSSRPISTASVPDPTFLISGWHDNDLITSSLTGYGEARLRWTLPGFCLPGGIQASHLCSTCSLLSKIMAMGAYSGGSGRYIGMAVSSSDDALVQAMQAGGFVEMLDNGRAILTGKAVAGMRTCAIWRKPFLVFEPRMGFALKDHKSTYQFEPKQNVKHRTAHMKCLYYYYIDR